MNRNAARNLLSLLVALLWATTSQLAADDQSTVFPKESWSIRSPEDVGLDADQVDKFAKAVGGDGVLIRDGYLVKTWGRPYRRGDWASSVKPVISTLLLFAVEEGRLKKVDDAVRPWVQKRWPGKDLIKKDRTMTFRHLANMTSGYHRAEPPGTHWAYNDYAIKLYCQLMTEVLGTTLNEAALDRLQSLDFQDGNLFGSRGGAGVNTSPRDFARIGWFWLNRGNWNGKQLLPQKAFALFCKPDVPRDLPRSQKSGRDYLGLGTHGGGTDQDFPGQGVYGFNWWFNAKMGKPDEYFLPHLPHDTFCTIGHRGKEVMLMIPSLRIVVAARGNWGDIRLERTKLLIEAVVDKKPVQAEEMADDSQFGQYSKWSKIEFVFHGPSSQGEGQPNPFAVRLDAEFTSPRGKQFRVPGFYDGDGRGGLDGNVWKVRFSADETGSWSVKTKSDVHQLDKQTGRFSVVETPLNSKGFWKWGRLESKGTVENKIRYLKFRDGPYWLKAGCDDPENFLGNYKNYDTTSKRKAAVDFLADRGINSMYIMTHNIGGDDKDVWPWLGANTREAMANSAKNARFNISKLEAWHELFDHMQTQGVVPYLVLEDDSAWKGYDHKRYYREIIARFGYLPALIFNCGEEHNENYRLAQALDFMHELKNIDPYDHPRGIHNVNRPNNDYIDAEHIDLTSIQTGSPGSRTGLENALEHNRITIDWIERCIRRKKRILMVNFDEARPEEDRRCWWSVYLAGGLWETHVRQPYDRPLTAWEPVWTQLGGARAFMESIPFWEMNPHNEIVIDGRAFCLAKDGQVYALYLPTGGSVTLSLPPDFSYNAAWWDPANGRTGKFQNQKTISGGKQRLTAPSNGDWALRIVRRTAN